MRSFTRSVIVWVLRVGLAAVYLIAAIPKIADPWTFARSIHNFRLLPAPAITPIALALPPLEAIAALAVMTGLLYRGGVLCVTVLSLAFAGGIGSAIARGLDIECGCFGSLARSSANLPHLALNLGTAAAGLILLGWSARPRRRRRLPR